MQRLGLLIEIQLLNLLIEIINPLLLNDLILLFIHVIILYRPINIAFLILIILLQLISYFNYSNDLYCTI